MMLQKVFNSIDSGEVSLVHSFDMEFMMTKPNGRGFRIFDLAVIEGSADHLSLAETLRNRYRISFDDYTLPSRSEKDEIERVTLLGHLVKSSVSSNVIEIESLEYLLNLSPQPKFCASTSGDTFLHYAVCGFTNVEMSSNPVGYAVLRLLLQNFPEKEYMYKTNDRGITPLHTAAYFSNATAIDMIQSHINSLKDNLDWNRLCSAGTTPLDHAGQVRSSIRISEEEHRALHEIIKRNTTKCFVKIRELGGQFSKELDHTIPIVMMVSNQNELSRDRLLSWLRSMHRSHGFDWRFIEEPGIPVHMADTKASSFVVEVCWAFDHFILQGTAVRTDQLPEYTTARLRNHYRSTNGNTIGPWYTVETVQEVQHNMKRLLGEEVRWTRQGKAWTDDEILELCKIVGLEWVSIFEEALSITAIETLVIEAMDSELDSAGPS